MFTVDRDGKNVRQITRDGNNQQPQLVAVSGQSPDARDAMARHVR